MTELTIIEDGQSFTAQLRKQVASCDVTVRRIPTVTDARETDIAVVSPGCKAVPFDGGSKLRCKILLIPGGLQAGFADAGCVVTYGMSAKDTITLSSIGEDNCVLALQRELVTAPGGVLDRQEIKVNAVGAGAGSADELLAASGAILLLGLDPNEVGVIAAT